MVFWFCLMNVITFSLIYLRVLIDKNRERTGPYYGRGAGQRELHGFSFSIVFGYFFILVFVFYIRNFVQMSGNILLSAYRATLNISSFNFLFFPLFFAGSWSYFSENNLISSLKCKNLAARVLEAQFLSFSVWYTYLQLILVS